jgi:3',5'-nucleoside bisphosphate phosphatase
MKYIDLHIHSLYSDGTSSPEEIISLAKNKDLAAISITDHDTITGTIEAVNNADEELEIISGIEFSTSYKGIPLHILGYDFSLTNKELTNTVHQIQRNRQQRNQEIIVKLQNADIDISLIDLKKYSPIGQIGRPHFAQFLIEHKIVKNMDHAFASFLGNDAIAYAPRKKFDVFKAIKIIKQASGLAFLAHPAIIDYTLESLPPLLNELKDAGLDGIEVLHPSSSKKISSKLNTLATQMNILTSGGSDFHGEITNRRLGRAGSKTRIPYLFFEKIKSTRITR